MPAFRNAIAKNGLLTLCNGLQAVTGAEGAGQIHPVDERSVLGSVAIDRNYAQVPQHGNASRWDYVIGYRRGPGQEIAYFIEVHSAKTSEVATMQAKLEWLRSFLNEPANTQLGSLDREVHWLAAGRVAIPKHTPEYKRLTTTLRRLGLAGPPKNTITLR